MDASAPIPPANAAASHARALRVLTGVMLCVLLGALDQTVVIPAVPAIAADLNGFGHLSWIVTAYLLTSVSCTPIYGKLSDIYGRRALLLPAIVLFVAASGLCGMAQDLGQLIVFRALQGMGGGGLMAMAQASIADVIAPRERGRYQAYLSGMWGIASVAGPVLGGLLVDHLSWRWIFWINLPLGIAALILSNRALRNLTVHRREVRIDYPGAVLMAGCVTASLLVMSWGGSSYPWASVQILGLSAVALGLLVALVAQERRSIEPLLPPRLFGHSVFTSAVSIAFLASAAMLGATFLLPLYFQLAHGVDAATSGTLLVPFLLASVAGAYASGQAARRFGRLKYVVLTGLAVATTGFALLTLLAASAGPVAIAALMVLMGAGLGTCMPSSLVIGQNAAERRDIGTATGALLLLRAMGGAFGSALAGAVLALSFGAALTQAGHAAGIDPGLLRTGFRAGFLACTVVSAAGLLVALLMRDLPLRSGN
ncbi:MFS transporter [Rhodovastum atsumiense]|nr:MFS transporter [Rhodovastum atsumiense]